MKNTDIAKIRQLLMDHCEECLRRKYFNSSRKPPDACDNEDAKLCKISQALTLLPCKTCRRTGKTNRICVDIEGVEFIAERDVSCPDCPKNSS